MRRKAPGWDKVHAYARTRDPTRDALDRCMADLDQALAGVLQG